MKKLDLGNFSYGNQLNSTLQITPESKKTEAIKRLEEYVKKLSLKKIKNIQ